MEKEKMFNLNEAWEVAYQNFLLESEEEDYAEVLSIAEEASAELEKTMAIVETHFKLCGWEGMLTEDATSEDFMSNVKEFLKSVKTTEASSDRDLAYQSVSGFKTVKSISDLKFPMNIVHWVMAIAKYLKDFILFLIKKVIGLFGKLLGKKWFKDSKKPDFEDYKKIVSKIETKFGTTVLPEKGDKSKATTALMRVITVNSDNVKENDLVSLNASVNAELNGEILDEGILSTLLGAAQEKPAEEEKPREKEYKVFSIDVSRDLLDIEQYMAHFFKLYDDAIGSNNEKLFGTADLEIILSIFEASLKGIEKRNLPAYEIDGRLGDLNAIDAGRMKDNLYNTKLNLDALKDAYTQTAEKIKKIGEIVGHKQIMALSQYGVQFKILSKSTYTQLEVLYNAINPRFKDGERQMRELERMKGKLERTTKDLEKFAAAYNAVSGMTFSTVYQRKITELLESSKYLLQTITLRLTALALYLREMRDIMQTIDALLRVSGEKITPAAPVEKRSFFSFFNTKATDTSLI